MMMDVMNMSVKKKIKEEKKRMETTKKLLLFTDGLLLVCLAATFFGWFKMLEVSSIVTLDISVIGMSTALHGFYIWKAKHENCQKNVDVNAFIEQYGVDAYRAMTSDSQQY